MVSEPDAGIPNHGSDLGSKYKVDELSVTYQEMTLMRISVVAE